MPSVFVTTVLAAMGMEAEKKKKKKKYVVIWAYEPSCWALGHVMYVKTGLWPECVRDWA